MIYAFNCPKCEKRGIPAVHEINRPMARSGEPYACPDCGGACDRIYSSSVEKERLYDDGGKRFSSFSQHEKYLKTKGRVLTEATTGWRDIKKMAKEGQRRTQLAQKGHY